MPTPRYATAEDAALITLHRHKMFADNHFAKEGTLAAADVRFEHWVHERLLDGRYIGLFLEEKTVEETTVIAGAGIFFADFPPHWMDSQPFRAYVLNVYTAPEHRGRGHAKQLVYAVFEEYRRHKVLTVVLHASPFGRPIYKKLGFKATDEMMLRFETFLDEYFERCSGPTGVAGLPACSCDRRICVS